MPTTNPAQNTPAGEPEAPETVTREELMQLRDAVLESQQKSAQQVEQWSQQVVKAVSARSAPAEPSSKPEPPPNPDDLLHAIAAGDLSPIDRRIQEGVQRGMKETLGPWLREEIPAKIEANENAARSAIDSEFGPGVYNELIKPAIDAGFQDRTADKAMPQQFKNALDMVKGRQLEALLAKKSEFQKQTEAQKAEEAQRAKVPFMPGAGFQYVEENEVSETEREQLGKLRRAGLSHVPSEEDAAKLRDLMLERGVDGVTLEDFNKAGLFGAKA